jgi:hypothetical protein
MPFLLAHADEDAFCLAKNYGPWTVQSGHCHGSVADPAARGLRWQDS